MNRKQRHLGRELALLWLYQIDAGKVPVEDALADISEEIEGAEEEAIDFGRSLVRGITSDKVPLDRAIVKYARGWSFSRLAIVERNILRIALYEIMNMPDIPASVSIDEAVEFAKRYGSEESGKFVNGILGAYMRGEKQNPEVA